jgi:hypothetical protein
MSGIYSMRICSSRGMSASWDFGVVGEILAAERGEPAGIVAGEEFTAKAHEN